MKVLLFDLSEAKTIRKIRQKTESWSPLAKDQIIAQGMLRPIICHGGYAPDSAKRAVIWANGGKLSGTFELIDVTTNKQPPALPSVVYTGTLEEAGSHIWGGNNYVADFSDFRQEGLFWIPIKSPSLTYSESGNPCILIWRRRGPNGSLTSAAAAKCRAGTRHVTPRMSSSGKTASVWTRRAAGTMPGITVNGWEPERPVCWR